MKGNEKNNIKLLAVFYMLCLFNFFVAIGICFCVGMRHVLFIVGREKRMPFRDLCQAVRWYAENLLVLLPFCRLFAMVEMNT